MRISFLTKWQLTLAGFLVVCIVSSGCMYASPPRNTADACKIFSEKRDWYRHAIKAERKWKVPVSLMLAIIKKESSFVHDARPPRKRGWFNLPGRRPSSAYGYPQAKDETWNDYRERNKRWGAKRHNFGDAVDFVGWYMDMAADHLKLKRSDVANLYIAYHDGMGGYKAGTWKGSAWMLKTSAAVATQAKAFQRQLQSCKSGPARRYLRQSRLF